VTEQQLLAVSGKCQQARRRRARGAAAAAAAGGSEAAAAAQEGAAADWQALQDALCPGGVLQELSEAAAAAPAGGAAALATAADAAAQRWLAAALARLPRGTAVVSMSQAATRATRVAGGDAAGEEPGLLVCRLGPLEADGQLPPPLLAVLPPPEGGLAA
jgi:hypothetical protein